MNDTAPPARAGGRFLIPLMAALTALAMATTSIYLPSLPSMARDLSASIGEVQLTLTLYMAVYGLAQLVMGPLSDRYGRRPVMISGLALAVLASIGCAAAYSVGMLLTARVIQGIGACVGVVTARAVIRDVYDRQGSARALSVMTMVVSLAPIAAPIVGGYIEIWAGWRVTFLLVATLTALVMAAAIRLLPETNRNLHRFESHRADYQDSEAYFRMMMLVTVLQQDFGIRYNPQRVTPVGVFEPNDRFFGDSRDVFLHGLTGQPSMGTCSSLPVLYVAVGRRLRYPLSLVTAKGHLFLRWQDQKERLNVEAASLGMNSHDDSHYRKWPYPFTDEEEREDGYLQNLSPAEELVVFLTIRGACLMSAGQLDESIAAFEHAARIAPGKRVNKLMLNAARSDAARRRQPAPRTGGLPGTGMPPDPSLWNDPPEIAWMLWEQQQARRRQRVLPGGVPEPMPGAPAPLPGHPLPGRNPALPFPPPAP